MQHYQQQGQGETRDMRRDKTRGKKRGKKRGRSMLSWGKRRKREVVEVGVSQALTARHPHLMILIRQKLSQLQVAVSCGSFKCLPATACCTCHSERLWRAATIALRLLLLLLQRVGVALVPFALLNHNKCGLIKLLTMLPQQ